VHRLIVSWPDHAFGSADEAARVATIALSDASKALGVNEPTIEVVNDTPE
jgi:hypothetical protein